MRARSPERVAINVDTAGVVYRKTLGVTDSYPADMQNTGRPGAGGTIQTASGLSFVGGTDDQRFRAFRTATGEQFWEMKLSASITMIP